MRTESMTAAPASLALPAVADGSAVAQCTSVKPVTRTADPIGLVYESPISRRVVEQGIDCSPYRPIWRRVQACTGSNESGRTSGQELRQPGGSKWERRM